MTTPEQRALRHRQYDELPLRDLILSFPTVAEASWPALAASDRVTLLVKRGTTTTAVALTIVDPVTQRVRWSPSGTLIQSAGKGTYVVRVTPTVGPNTGLSYTHPEVGAADFEIEPAIVVPDPVDPA